LNLFIDTSVWSLHLRRDAPATSPQLQALRDALGAGQTVFSTGLVLQELLQGISGPRNWAGIIEGFAAVPLLDPGREDHIAAAELRNGCRRRGVQIGTVDALLAQLCIRHDLTMLSVDQDFVHIAGLVPLKLWQ
jgi:hypothetical protein